MAQLEGQQIQEAVLQPRSPTCGVHQVYDGSFNGRLIPGQGLFAKAPATKGIPVIDGDELANQ